LGDCSDLLQIRDFDFARDADDRPVGGEGDRYFGGTLTAAALPVRFVT
jgi:hypothetical protein